MMNHVRDNVFCVAKLFFCFCHCDNVEICNKNTLLIGLMLQAHRSLVVSMTTTWRCHRFESWLVYGDPSLGLPATLVEEIGLKIVNSHL
jgi:hypothetical protein